TSSCSTRPTGVIWRITWPATSSRPSSRTDGSRTGGNLAADADEEAAAPPGEGAPPRVRLRDLRRRRERGSGRSGGAPRRARAEGRREAESRPRVADRESAQLARAAPADVGARVPPGRLDGWLDAHRVHLHLQERPRRLAGRHRARLRGRVRAADLFRRSHGIPRLSAPARAREDEEDLAEAHSEELSRLLRVPVEAQRRAARCRPATPARRLR